MGGERVNCEMRSQGNFRFECKFCGEKFMINSRLICHERIHTGERPFVCPLPSCNSAYMSKTNLVTHVKQTHKRNLKDVLKEQGKVDVYSGRGPSAIIVGISGTVFGNVGPGKPRKPKK